MSEDKYQVVVADCSESRREHFRIRYRVFCQETSFEPSEYHPDGLERDIHDNQAVHFLAGRVGSDGEDCEWLGTMRLIRPEPLPLPLQQLIATELGSDDANATPTFRRGAVEVSRLIVRPQGRQSCSQSLMYMLCRAAWAYAMKEGVEQLYFMVRPGLARVLRSRGLPLEVFAPPVEHRGLRLPCRVETAALGLGLRAWRSRLSTALPVTPFVSHAAMVEERDVLPEPAMPYEGLATHPA